MRGRGLDSRGLLTRDLTPLIDIAIAIYRPDGDRLTVVGTEPSPVLPTTSKAQGRFAAKVSDASDGSTLDVAWLFFCKPVPLDEFEKAWIHVRAVA